ncbi:hypothetical protein K1719_042358 [Acacia pycnantha]|nr:hypothetical protein K1719_042358 [Acacia pycnantha]
MLRELMEKLRYSILLFRKLLDQKESVSDSIMGKISQKSKNRTEEQKEDDYRRMGLELVSVLSTELYNVKKTATIDLDVLASSVSNLKDGMAKLQYVVQELHADERSENFVNSMKAFLN